MIDRAQASTPPRGASGLLRRGRRFAPPLGTAICVGVLVAFLLSHKNSHDILDLAYAYDGGGYCALSDSGVPVPISFAGVTILPGSKSHGSYCCGFTFLIAMKAARARGLLKGKEAYEVKRFQREWYGATKASQERQLVLALEDLGIGHAVNPLDARPGDFVVFWRRGGVGHSVIFLRWVRQDHKIVGIEFRGSQPATRGVGDMIEYFTTSGRADGFVIPHRLYIGRLDS